MTTPASRAQAPAAPGAHACAFFRSEEDEYAVLLPLTVDCVHCGERCIQLVDGRRRSERLRRLEASGIDVHRLTASGQLDVLDWDATYLRGGSFDVEAQLVLVRELMRDAEGASPRSKFWADMGWSTSGAAGCERLIEYESRLNGVLGSSSGLVVCAYDIRLQGARMVIDLLHTHPFVLHTGVLRANPLYVPPEEFLPDFHSRRANE
jgi:hypothetical protein